MLLQQDSEALGVAVLTDHVTGRITFVVFCIIVSVMAVQNGEDLSIATNTGNMKRSAQVLGLAVELGAKAREDVDHFDVAFVASNV